MDQLTKFSLGHLIGLLARNRDDSIINAEGTFLNEEDQEELQHLKYRLTEIQAGKLGDEILSGIPMQECPVFTPFLKENQDFFLCLIFTVPYAAGFNHHCLQLSQHLNNCFQCFEIYCQFFQDYNQVSRVGD